MKHYILYSHDGSGNHGCEALVRTTIELLQDSDTSFTLSSTRPEEDLAYGIDKLCDVVKIHSKSKSVKKDLKFLKAYYQLKAKKNYIPMDRLAELEAFNARKGDIAFSIGGDSYCYGFTDEMAIRNKLWKKGGLKTVYWGCSIEPDLLEDPEIAKDIATFDLITARESISYEALKRVNSNTILVSDSAFALKTVKEPLPIELNNREIVGLNLSPLVENLEKKKGIIRRNYEVLIEHIINNTDWSIMLIPHVVWEGTDDRIINNFFFDKYKDCGRVFAVEDANCEVLKGYISRCRFFIGARTHATIAAYSSCVPTIVLGYSVKSKGIAKDLFGSYENYVLPVQSIKQPNNIVDAFKWLVANEDRIKNNLQNVLPEYINRVYDGVSALKKL